jgi:hypothetical protein
LNVFEGFLSSCLTQSATTKNRPDLSRADHLPFAFFGVDSYVRSTGTGDDVAKIGDIKITQQQFQQAMRDQQERLRAQMGELDPKLLDTPEARQAIHG